MASDPVTSQHFGRSLAVAAARAERESIDDIGTLLVRQVALLQAIGRLLHVNYQGFYENERDGWLLLTLYTEALYQQLHATLTTAGVMLGRKANPPLAVDGLAELEQALGAAPEHPLAPRFRQIVVRSACSDGARASATRPCSTAPKPATSAAAPS